MTRQLAEVVPNAWRAHEISKEILSHFCSEYGEQKTTDNFVFIIEQSRRLLEKSLDNLAHEVFLKLINEEKLRFVLLAGDGGWRIPTKIKTYRQSQLIHDDNSPLQKSLLEKYPQNDFNTLEKEVALYLDNQEKLLWWYRNRARVDYRLQGWKKHKIYPDFIATKTKDGKKINEVTVLEVKGVHLKNDDTAYKQSIFNLCNDFCKKLKVIDLDNAKKDWQKLGLNFQDNTFCFQVVHQDEWKSVINNIFSR